MTNPSLATGAPDFLQNPPSNPTSPVWDMGEAANHELLGGGGQSRSGRWYWATGFETGIAKDVQVGGAGTVVSSTLGAWQGKFALLMQTVATIGDISSAFKYFLAQNSPSGRWGIEAMIAIASSGATFDLILQTTLLPNAYRATFRILSTTNPASLKFQYADDVGVFHNIPTPVGSVNQQGQNFAISSQVFHNIKLIVDFSTFKYVRAIVDGVSYDLSGIDMQIDDPGDDVRQSWQMVYTTTVAGVATALVDNVVLTADEP